VDASTHAPSRNDTLIGGAAPRQRRLERRLPPLHARVTPGFGNDELFGGGGDATTPSDGGWGDETRWGGAGLDTLVVVGPGVNVLNP
jgi:hypothetical protein